MYDLLPIVIITIIFMLSCTHIIIKYFNKCNFINDPKYLTHNNDKFFNRLNRVNLYARKVNSVSEYIKRIEKSIVHIDIFDKIKIINHINEITHNVNKLSIPWLNVKKFTNMKWNIICFDGYYEQQMPHTRDNVIALPKHIINSDRLQEILFHEQLHVYQKTFSREIKHYIDKHFKVVGRVTELCRANPDTDTLIYANNDKIFGCVFNSFNPKSLLDVRYSFDNHPKTEHPLELLVYDAVNLYAQKNL